MIKPIFTYNQNNNYSNRKHNPSFSANILSEKISSNTSAIQAKENPPTPPWVKDNIIIKALKELSKLKFDPQDIQQVQKQGAILPFLSGKEATKFIENANVRIKFAPMSSVHTHAQYDFENNFININEIYKNTQNLAEILAISEAILHEAGHAKDQDGFSSIQEEIDCLALNATAHKALEKKYPDTFNKSEAFIVKDGVCVYSDLFFANKQEDKNKLVERIKDRYGFLYAGDFKHPPGELAFKIKS